MRRLEARSESIAVLRHDAHIRRARARRLNTRVLDLHKEIVRLEREAAEREAAADHLATQHRWDGSERRNTTTQYAAA